MRKSARFSALAATLESVRGTSSKNEKVSILASFIASLGPEDAEVAARVATGRASPRGSKDEAQVGYSTLLDVIQEVSGASRAESSKVYLKFGDLGEVAQVLLKEKKETTLFSEPLTISDLEDAFGRMRSARGKGSAAARKGVAKSLLLRASPLEAKYVVKVLTGEMRTGLVHGLLEEAVAKAHGLPGPEVARAHLLLGDAGLLAAAAARGELGRVKMTPFRPVNFMLAEPMSTPDEIAERFDGVAYAEFKYDGVRAQVHKLANEVRIYSRRLEEITSAFPEVVSAARELAHDWVMDGEIVPFSGGKPLPFQLLQRRLRRMEGFEEAAKNAPVNYFAFDLLYLDGKELYGLPLRERSEELSALLAGHGIPTAERSVVEGAGQIASMFRRSRESGYEGLVLKDPESVYTMGKRGAGWVKLKEELDSIDAVIVGAEYGHGKRAGVISDYTFAVRDGEMLKTIGKAYSGLTDEEIDQMTERLKRITVKDFGYSRAVKPEIVIEVAFDSIQRSDRHDSGFALRFPRIKRIRDDKSPSDVDTLDRVRSIFASQKVKLGEA
ncbi:MAG: ATP-dependent DNA ligase [Nitrososphaerales archaeon]|nr:ATP-dependent DNA ligase [Nitrososphaerales archaeon]